MTFRKITLVILGLLLALSAQFLSAQNAYDSLDVNRINARFYSGGDMFWDLNNQPKFMVDGKASMFSGALWIGGLDQSGQLHLAAQTYRQGGLDYWSGPLTNNTATTDSATIAAHDQIWSLSRSELNSFLIEFQANGSIAQPGLYPHIYDWPAFTTDANGNQIALAPFVDVNADQDYDPNDGDYPVLKGDKQLFWVFNDNGGVHAESGGQALGVEIHATAYAYSCHLSQAQQTIFLEYKIVNKSSQDYSDVYLGYYADLDIGNYADDYVGVDTLRHMFFGYNGDADDETAAGYGLNPPAQAVGVLQGPLADPGDGIDNDRDGTTDEPGEEILLSNFMYYENDLSVRGNPTQPDHYYMYMQSMWKDTTPAINNGTNGHSSGGTGTPTAFLYPGDAGWCGNAPSGWSEVSASNQPFDRRGLGSMGPFSLDAGDKQTVTFNFTWERGFFNNNLGSVCFLSTLQDSVAAFFQNGSGFCNTGITSGPGDVWPGDCNFDRTADVFDLLPIGYAFGDTGLARPTANLMWTGQPSPAWGTLLPVFNTDLKHVDCDGDSFITADDTLAISLNYGFTHNKTFEIQGTNSSTTLSFEFLQDSLQAGDTAYVEVYLGDTVNPADSVYGLAFSLAYDAELVDPGSIWVDYSNCWMGTPGSSLLTMQKDLNFAGQLDIGLSRIDHQNVSGSGQLMTIGIVTIDNISGKNDLLAKALGLNVIRLEARTAGFEELSFSIETDSTIVWQSENSRPGPIVLNDLKLYPNPSTGKVVIELEKNRIEQVRIWNMLGQPVHQENAWSNELTLNLEQLKNGTYFLEVVTPQGVYRKRLIIQR